MTDPSFETRQTWRDTLAVLLTVFGGAAWLVAPVALILKDLRLTLSVVTVAGCGLGGLAAAAVIPGLPRISAMVAGGLAHLIARGMLVLWGLMPGGALGAEDAVIALIAGAAAGLGTTAGRRAPRGVALTLVAAMVSLAVVVGVYALFGVLHRLGLERLELGWIGFFLAPVIGGLVAAALFDDVTPSRVAAGWLVFGLATSAMVAAVSRSGVLFAGGIMLSVFAGFIPAGLGALGAGAYRRYGPRPRPDAELPSARVVP